MQVASFVVEVLVEETSAHTCPSPVLRVLLQFLSPYHPINLGSPSKVLKKSLRTPPSLP